MTSGVDGAEPPLLPQAFLMFPTLLGTLNVIGGVLGVIGAENNTNNRQLINNKMICLF